MLQGRIRLTEPHLGQGDYVVAPEEWERLARFRGVMQDLLTARQHLVELPLQKQHVAQLKLQPEARQRRIRTVRGGVQLGQSDLIFGHRGGRITTLLAREPEHLIAWRGLLRHPTLPPLPDEPGTVPWRHLG